MDKGSPSLVEARRRSSPRPRSSRSASALRALRPARGPRRRMASVDVPVALLGYGTVGAAVNRLLNEQADDIERATGHRLRVVKALVRDLDKEREFPPADGVLTTDIDDDPRRPVDRDRRRGDGRRRPDRRATCSSCCARGKHVVTANKQLVARRGAELFAAASSAGVQLRFEASVCAAIPVIKVLRESLVVTNVHRVLGIVNGTTNFMLTEMEAGKTYDEALAEAQATGFAEADPDRRRLRRRRGGEDGDPRHRRVQLALRARRRRHGRHRPIDALDVAAARELEMVIRLSARRGSSTARSTSASGRRSSTATTRWPRSRAPSTRSCCRATRSARSRSRARAPAASRPPRP